MPTGDFFDYFPVTPLEKRWGIQSGAFGHVNVPPGSAYPPARHPDDHHFAWEQGRVLHEYQILYISRGRGRFESASAKPATITEGMGFIIAPGVWHRYRPDAAAGWTETWIEVQGPEVMRLRKAGIIDPKRPVYHAVSMEEITALLEEAQRLARLKPQGFSVRIGLIALQILTLLDFRKSRRQPGVRRIDRLVSDSQTLMIRNANEQLSPGEIARQMGVGYSYFRRMFKQQTGLSPKQYQADIRLRRAKDLLRNTALSIQEISDRLHYHSPYHLSLDFSKRTGMPPSKWRKRV